jgi:putative phosphotransacetylase
MQQLPNEGQCREALLARAITTALRQYMAQVDYNCIPVGVSARHIHLSKEDLAHLFGPGYQLTPTVELMPGQYATKETLILVGPKGIIQNARVLGPPRSRTQVEVSRTDGFVLGINPPVRDSGDIQGSPGLILVGPHGAVTLKEGAILASRHMHLTPQWAAALGVKDGDRVKIRTNTARPVVFENVLARVSPDFWTQMHLDTDEANAAGLSSGDRVKVL